MAGQVAHTPGSTHWGLVVQDTRSSDAGLYHCTVNTDPQLYSVVTLIVTAKQSPSDIFAKGKVFVANNTASTTDGRLSVSIDGPRELHIEEGSSLTLRCTVRSTTALPSVVYWYHANTLLDYNSPRGGVQLQSDAAKGSAVATLRVWAVGPGDSGMYSCVPQGSHPASVLVHVQKGDREAAIQQGGLEGPSSTPSSSPSLLFFQSNHSDAASWLMCLFSTPTSRRPSHAALFILLIPLLQAPVFLYCRLLFSP
ncbi:Immunoglobulin-like domain [Trinorchestia longiramus]|nr:Immunoglobulin-like domain [Trinorchestia longiramus]